MQEDLDKNLNTLKKYASLKAAVKETQKVKFLAYIHISATIIECI